MILTIGTFDSLHKGHLKILNEVRKQASRKGAKACVITFENRPKHILSRRNDGIILGNEDRLEYFKDLGMDLVLLLRFNTKLARMSPLEFLERLNRSFQVQAIIVGEDFRFGSRNKGTVRTLEQYSERFGYSLRIFRNVREKSEKISTSAIKNHILKGEIEQANRELGRYFSLRGRVVKGQGLGKKIKFPTINLELINKSIIIPDNGVYLTRIGFKDRSYYGMTYVGMKFINKRFVIETNIFRFHRNIYGERIILSFIKKLRNEKRFVSIKGLTEQLVQDRDQAICSMKNIKRRFFS
ncbi:MAG: bifunctional riboflavin kinase/FAD synthetase [bacterium]|nr:bifunctional riboflavin kinase/FAD synthetase [bacterium]